MNKTEEKQPFDRQKTNKQTLKGKSKSLAKAMGLKSTIVYGDKLYLTSFEDVEKNISSPSSSPRKLKQKIIHCSNVEALMTEDGQIAKNPIMFDTKGEKILQLTSRMMPKLANGKSVQTQIRNPLLNESSRMIGADYIGIKEVLEKKIFGQTFPGDNLHIQIAYNILDIKKILVTYVNNIIQIFFNLNRRISEEDKVRIKEELEKNISDDLGTLQAKYRYEEQGRKNLAPILRFFENTEAYAIYFDDVFPARVKKEDDVADKEYKKEKDKYQESSYNVWRVLSLIRQLCMHATVEMRQVGETKGGKIPTEKRDTDVVLFNLERELAAYSELRDLITRAYNSRVREIKTAFFDNSKKNIGILKYIYQDMPEESGAMLSVESLAQEYYEIGVLKDDKTVGLNLTTLREILIQDIFPQEYELRQIMSCRNKFNMALNFILHRYFLHENKELLTETINKLRFNRNGEEGKAVIYRNLAKQCKDDVYQLFQRAYTATRAIAAGAENKFTVTVGEIIQIKEIPGKVLEKRGLDKIDLFVQLLYYISKFLDGKEINELLCAFWNKFNNIAGLLDIARYSGNPIAFSEEYALFKNSRKISNQIFWVKNIARMKSNLSKGSQTFCRQNVRDALNLLGIEVPATFKRDKDGKFISGTDGKRVETQESKRFWDEIFAFDGKSNTHWRNFLCKNVLANRRFFYIVKYCDPRKCNALMKNRELIEFALRGLPESQIKRYCVSIGKPELANSEAGLKNLSDYLSRYNILDMKKTISGMPDEEYADKNSQNVQKTHMRALISLYLTVVYIITKNMIKVNSRFSIAFNALERDTLQLTGRDGEAIDLAVVVKGGGEEDVKENNKRYLALTERMLKHDEPIMERVEARRKQDCGLSPQEAALRRKTRRKDLKEMLRGTHYDPYAYQYLKKNFESAMAGGSSIEYREFRNKVEHLNVINEMYKYLENVSGITSYYACYCYVLQRKLFEKAGKDDSNGAQGSLVKEYYDYLMRYGKYNKDAMKVLCLPFAYNLPRYKNLSVEGLFEEYAQKDGGAAKQENRQADEKNR